MFETVSRKYVLMSSSVLMAIMFVIVMFVVNPHIDGGNGVGVVKLQLSFSKETGIEIVNGWGEEGIASFEKWIFTDYIYAFAYAVFFASLLSSLILKKGKEKLLSYTWVVYMALAAGTFDWIENTIELLFLENTVEFSSSLFFIHSILATLKWTAAPIAIVYIVVLLTEKNTSIPNR